jgi:hypothetical protein
MGVDEDEDEDGCAGTRVLMTLVAWGMYEVAESALKLVWVGELKAERVGERL